MPPPTLRPATIDDATVSATPSGDIYYACIMLAELVNHAGEGIPLYLWDQMAEPGEAAWDVGRRRDSGPSYRSLAPVVLLS
jgi:hypothetical protein